MADLNSLKLTPLMASKPSDKPYTGHELEIAGAIDKIVDAIDAAMDSVEGDIALCEPAAIGDMETAITDLETVVGDGTAGLVADVVELQEFMEGTDVILDSHIDWGTGANQVSAEDIPIADGDTLFATDNVEAALTEAMTDLDAAEVDIDDLEDAIPSAAVLHATNQQCLPFYFLYDVTEGSASIKICDADAPFNMEVVNVIVQPRASEANGTVKITNGTNDITDAMVCATDKTMVTPATIDDAYSTIAEGGTLEIVCAGDAVGDVKALVTVIVVKRPV